MHYAGICAISGKLCSGKTRQATLLTQYNGYFKAGFARALKEDLERLTGKQITPKNKGVFRPLLQEYGTAMRGLHGQYFWVTRLLRESWVGSVLVIDDLRYRSEKRFLEEYCYWTKTPLMTVRLYFPDTKIDLYSEMQDARHLAQYGTPVTAAVRQHISETDLDQGWGSWDMLIRADLNAEQMHQDILAGLRQRGFPATNSYSSAVGG